ncbi:hypothetical protein SAMN05443550_103121 [Pedobacter hartonius]|uniref:Uncharacterized protein n=1 Tax=Pedobacter hartonius TaxID=425514 RepID=A0A1H4AWP9_9SPHI|nr:hypothetical protein SAMN05443550_103121 [Pedobacter hartonius]
MQMQEYDSNLEPFLDVISGRQKGVELQTLGHKKRSIFSKLLFFLYPLMLLYRCTLADTASDYRISSLGLIFFCIPKGNVLFKLSVFLNADEFTLS